MKTTTRALLLAGAIAASSCSAPNEPAGDPPVVDIAAVRSDLETVARSRVLFGHQSVGRNILSGIQTLADEAGIPVRIVDIEGGLPPDEAAGLFHASIGENGDPDSKCQDFAQLLTRPERPAYDAAIIKFCYSDLDHDTPLGPPAMLDRYATLVSDLRAARPEVALLHITIPLRAEPPGRRTSVQRLLGMQTREDAGNIARNTFNAGLLERFAGEPIVDIAKIQSTRLDGTRSAFSEGGQTFYMLVPEYSPDRAHLNAQGQRLVAAEFLSALADVLRVTPAAHANHGVN
jgi:lysophospholipase L1-like esterase